MNPVAQSAEALPASLAAAHARKDSAFWPGLLLAFASTSIVVGLIWDISWHISIGRDTFWTAAHMAVYLGGVLAGSVGGWLALRHTFFAGPEELANSVSILGLRAPLGAWLAIWGALAMLTSAPFDDWWHNAYGLDVKIISPPHAVLGVGMFGISIGAVLLLLARQNRLALQPVDIKAGQSEPASSISTSSNSEGAGLFVYAGGIFITMGCLFLTEYTFPNMQHAALFYKVCCLMVPFRLAALGRAGRISFPATRMAVVYMALELAMMWILPLFHAQPKLAPIYSPITHMVPPAFPLLLVFPALAVDLVLARLGGVQGWLKKAGVGILLGVVFLAVFVPVQWFFARFMLTPQADNWFFAGNRFFGYESGNGWWRTAFWHVDPARHDADLLTLKAVLITLVFASIGSFIGLLWGNWMRRVKR